MSHSYEEMRRAALDIFAERENALFHFYGTEYDNPHCSTYEKCMPKQYADLSFGIARVFAKQEGRQHQQPGYRGPDATTLDAQEQELFLELFWDLFRQGIISLGCDNDNPIFPFFHVTSLGKRIAKDQDAYFFHDVSSYEKQIKSAIPEINEITLLYLKEAMQSFQCGCFLASTVMLGVAAEHTFLLLVDTIEKNSTKKGVYSSVFSQKTILQKVNKFKNIFQQEDLKTCSNGIKEGFDTHFEGILSVIRNLRNESGHPSGKIIDREQTFVLLRLFIPYCKKAYQLIGYFKS
ncbi:MAG: hypothetical protein LBH14_04095 [Desulfobulbaceae bacterium]|jgi:hypothetical protein|nr:hypothetical protein [Desulfobulbaceae bacterium]